MNTVLTNSTSNNNHRIGNPKWNSVSGPNRTLFPYPSDNFLYNSFLASGHFPGGSFLSMPSSIYPSPHNLHHYRQQPPLLPLPISIPPNHKNTNIFRTKSTPNKNIKNRVRARDQSLTPKKSKNQKNDSENKKSAPDLQELVPNEENEESVNININNKMIGPDPKDLPMEVCDVVSVDEFSGSAVFAPSPPPSSLPLPTFSLRPKVGCKAEASAVAVGVDVGATDSLRRLLRI